MPKKKSEKNEEDKTPLLITRLLSENKAAALGLAVTLALSGITLPASALSDSSRTWSKDKETVLVQEEEDDEDAEWEQDENQSYSSYGPGYGYFYRPIYFGGTYPGRARWSHSTTTKSVGGYHLSRGHVGS